MNRLHIGNVKTALGQKVVVSGFVQTIRDQGNIKFLIIRDITGTIQVVVTKGNKEAMAVVDGLSTESVVSVVGEAKEEKQAPGGYEIFTESIEVLSKAAELPIQVNEKGEDETGIQKRLDWRWLDLRKPESTLIFKAWTTMEQGFREYWTQNNYLEIHSPKIMGAPSESGAEVFEIKYFDRKAYLAQSPQFYKQMAMAAGFERVFEVGPVFRAEPSFTSRHATEFTGFDAEISYVTSHHDVMEEEEKAIVHMLTLMKEKHGEEIQALYNREVVIPAMPFPKITMAEAKEILKNMGVESEREGDLSPQEERSLSEYVKKERGHEFVFVTDYPKSVRPFYHMRHEENPELTKSFDLLWNGLEITTGAQREHRYDVLTKQAEEKGMKLESIQFYLNFFKFGCPPHGGMGLGPARMLQQLLGISNIREVTFVYRGVKRLMP